MNWCIVVRKQQFLLYQMCPFILHFFIQMLQKVYIVLAVDCFAFLKIINKIIPCASQNTSTMTLSLGGIVFAFSEADSPLSVHCSDWSFISGMKWWTHVSPMFVNQCSFIAMKCQQALDWNSLITPFLPHAATIWHTSLSC